MQSFDQALMMLFKKKLITYEEALRQSTRPDDFALKVKGIDGTSDSWSEMEKMSSDESGEEEAAVVPEEANEELKLDRF
jgi:twitching motility protein PilT